MKVFMVEYYVYKILQENEHACEVSFQYLSDQLRAYKTHDENIQKILSQLESSKFYIYSAQITNPKDVEQHFDVEGIDIIITDADMAVDLQSQPKRAGSQIICIVDASKQVLEKKLEQTPFKLR